MTEYAQPNATPGRCVKCSGSGEYRWIVGGAAKPVIRIGVCHSCGGSGEQTRSDIARNNSYNRLKLSEGGF